MAAFPWTGWQLSLEYALKYLPIIFISEFVGNFVTDLNVVTSASLAFSVVLEVFIGYGLLTRNKNFDTQLNHIRDFVTLAKAGAISACIAGIGAASNLWLLGDLDHQDVLKTFLRWWQGDFLGIILIAPLILVWRKWPKHWQMPGLIPEGLALALSAFAVGQIIYLGWLDQFFAPYAKAFWTFLFVMFAAVRFGRHGVLLIIILTVAQALTGAVKGVGFFATDLATTNLQNLWFFMIILTICGIALAINVEERTRREAGLLLYQRRLKNLMLRHEQVREDERRYIAREVHDELGQILSSMKMEISLLKLKTPQYVELNNEINYLNDLADYCLQAVRNIALHVRPPVLELGLLPAITWLVDNFKANSSMVCNLVITGTDESITEPYITTLFRIIQESLTNIVRHAQASQIEIHLAITSPQITLEIIDDGQGFDVDAKTLSPNSFGLCGMKERIEGLGGQFAIISKKGQGTTIHCLLPIPRQEVVK